MRANKRGRSSIDVRFPLLMFTLWLEVITVPVQSFSFKSRSTTLLHSGYSNLRQSQCIFVAASYANDGDQISLLNQANTIRNDAIDLAKRNDYARGLDSIRLLMDVVETTVDSSLRTEVLKIMDDAVGRFAAMAFSKPHRGKKDRWRVDTGLEALQLQLSSFPSPYDQVPRHLLVEALRALSAIIAQEKDRLEWNEQSAISTDTAFRILQRLLTGVGIRKAHGAATTRQGLSERDFNAVLNAVANAGRMDVAHKVVALQERTRNAPPLTPVTYSIMLKGYGRLRDAENVDMILKKADSNGVAPDTVMLNSILDALVNCNKVEEASAMFEKVIRNADDAAIPNIRTHNTMMKGFAVAGSLDKAKNLAQHMEKQKLWDAVTTNTLVSAAVNSQDFEYAEHVLLKYAVSGNGTEFRGSDRRDHPNVEAYTRLLDGYAKAGLLDKALGTLQRMRNLQVMPNEYTYTCMIAGLARMSKFESAVKLLDFMEASGIMPTAVTYNAFISALTEVTPVGNGDESDNDEVEPQFVEQSIEVLRRMVTKGVRPTVITISTLLECLAKCSSPRIGEATTIVQRFERDGIIPVNDAKVNTAMLRVYGAAKDVKGALDVFRRIEKPDIIAVNAFLGAACRSGELKVAFDTFDHLFGPQKHSRHYLTPDVITFSILMSSQLRLNTVRSVRKAQDLYQDMRSRRIKPDIALVDMVLATMTKGGRIGLQKADIQFTLQVLKDAKTLDWKTGELEQRKEAVRAIMVGRMSEVWKLNEDYYGMKVDNVREEEETDDLFRRKGWNKVDSGFRLWGGGDSIRLNQDKPRPPSEPIDNFLASKGWNDVDSGFRLF